MHLSSALAPPGLAAAAHVALWPLALAALLRAPWRRLRAESLSHAYFGACAVVLVLWQIRAQPVDGLGVHVLGASAMTMLFGWRLALVAVLAVLAASTAAGVADWRSYSLNAVVLGVVPVGFTHWFATQVYCRLPRNPFVYLFVSCFFGAALAAGASSAAASAVIAAAGHAELAATALGASLPMLFPEGFLSGAVLTLAVVYYPHWVLSFDDDRYLRG